MVSIQTFLSELLDSAFEIGPQFADVATRDPLSAVLVAFGALFVFGAVLVMGYLTLGAIADFVTAPFRDLGSRPGAR